MRTTIAILAAATALALPAVARAGGFATVGLGSLPDGTAPGKPWHVRLTILQHGRDPLAGLTPTLTIRSADGATRRTFAVRPAGPPGIYRADVVFPRPGRWSYVVDDGFSLRHTFAPVAIGASRAVATPGAGGSAASGSPAAAARPGSGSSAGSDVGAALGAAAIAGLLAALVSVALLRRRRPPAGTAAPAAR